MNVIVVLMLVVTVLSLMCALLFKIVIDMRKDNRTLKTQIERRTENIHSLLAHARGLGEIRKDSDELMRRIRNAKNDDDIDSVIGDILQHNNNRVPDAHG